MLNIRAVCRNNKSIANDYSLGRLNNTEFVRSQKPYFSKKKSGETKTKEANERKYTSRKNVCDVCFTTKSVLTQECLCDI